MKSIEASQNHKIVYNDPEIQKIYESAVGELATEGEQLQKEVKTGPKSNEDAKKLIKKGEIWAVAKYVDNYQGLDSEVAEALIKNGYEDSVLSHLGKFNCDKNLATVLIKYNHGGHVLHYFRHIKDVITPSEVIKLSIQYKYNVVGLVRAFLEDNKTLKFDNDVAHYLMTTKDTYDVFRDRYAGSYFLLMYLDRFEGLDNEIAKYLIKNGAIEEVIKNLSSFSKIDQIGIINRAMEVGVDFGILYDNKDNFSQEGKKRILEIRKQLNYHMIKDIDGQIKPIEKVEDRIKNLVSNVNLPGGSKLLLTGVKLIGGDNDAKGLGIFVKRKALNDDKIHFELMIEMDIISGKQTFKIPGLEGFKFKDNNEFFRIVNLLLWLKSHKKENISDKYCRKKGHLMLHHTKIALLNTKTSSETEILSSDTKVLSKSAIEKYYPSIKDNKKFLDYINSF